MQKASTSFNFRPYFAWDCSLVRILVGSPDVPAPGQGSMTFCCNHSQRRSTDDAPAHGIVVDLQRDSGCITRDPMVPNGVCDRGTMMFAAEHRSVYLLIQ